MRGSSDMLERIVASIALALFDWLERRIASGSVAVDSDRDDARLRRAGSRLRGWLRKNGAGHGVEPGPGGSVVSGPGLHAGPERVAPESGRSDDP